MITAIRINLSDINLNENVFVPPSFMDASLSTGGFFFF